MKPISPYILIGSIAITAAILLVSAVPLGVPGEWEWQRHAGFENAFDIVDRLAPTVIVGLVYFAIAVWGRRQISIWLPLSDDNVSPAATTGNSGLQSFVGRNASSAAFRDSNPPASSGAWLKTFGLYVLLMISAWGWLEIVQRSAPMTHRDVKPLWVLYDPGSAGYFLQATFGMDSVDEFLGGYEDRMKQGEVLHVGTHPPGLFLLSKACLAMCRSSPSLVAALSYIRSEAQTDAFRFVESTAEFGPELTTPELSALQLLSLISTLAVVLTIIPLRSLANWMFGVETGWMVCCLWPVLPCLAVFLPKSDLLFPFLSTAVLAMALPARTSSTTVISSVLAGVLLWLGLLLSLAHLALVALLLAFFIIRCIQTRGVSVIRDGLTLTVMFITGAAATLVFSSQTDCNLLRIWQLNLANHEAFYSQFHRTYWKWLLVNPLELALSVGLPVFLASLFALRTGLRQTFAKHDSSRHLAASAFCLAAFATVGALWLSGKNQGEAARLWCFLTPWLVVAVGVWLKGFARESASVHWQRLLLAQLLVCLLVVSKVSGFLF